jgi:hypothetical protein
MLRHPSITVDILPDQDIFTVSNMLNKLDAQLRGLRLRLCPALYRCAFYRHSLLVVKTTERMLGQCPSYATSCF